MAGELCGPGCGHCGACDGQYDDRNIGIDDQDVDDDTPDAYEVCAGCLGFGEVIEADGTRFICDGCGGTGCARIIIAALHSTEIRP